ncbi:MAG: YggT family protein [bacterium]|jgi:YggT family protein|nr:YggT family protein [bacterium]
MDELIRLAAHVYILIIIAAAIVSWMGIDREHPLAQFLQRATEPLFRRIRGLIPPVNGLDLSPLIALLAVKLAEKLLSALLRF